MADVLGITASSFRVDRFGPVAERPGPPYDMGIIEIAVAILGRRVIVVVEICHAKDERASSDAWGSLWPHVNRVSVPYSKLAAIEGHVPGAAMRWRGGWTCLAGVLGALLAVPWTFAQAPYPGKPIRLVHGFTA